MTGCFSSLMLRQPDALPYFPPDPLDPTRKIHTPKAPSPAGCREPASLGERWEAGVMYLLKSWLACRILLRSVIASVDDYGKPDGLRPRYAGRSAGLKGKGDPAPPATSVGVQSTAVACTCFG